LNDNALDIQCPAWGACTATVCNAGHGGSSCTACQPGHHSPANVGLNACQQCTGNTIGSNGTGSGSTHCTQCSTGHVANATRTECINIAWLSTWREPTTSNSIRLPNPIWLPETNQPEWSVTSPGGGTVMSGTVSGTSRCSTTNSNGSTPSTSQGLNCWCRMQAPVLGRWVWRINHGTVSDCFWSCAWDCAFCVTRGIYSDCTRTLILTPQ
jgi:hypothetical protein